MNRLNLIIRQKIFSIIFILIAILGGIFIFFYINNLKSRVPDDMEYQEIFIAKDDIPEDEIISKELLDKQRLPKSVFSEKFVLDINQILGKKVTADIPKGEIITRDKIEGASLNNNSELRFSSYIPQDLRAVSVPISYFGDKSLLRVGDKVDIISTYYEQSDSKLKSNTILYRKEIVLIENDFDNNSSVSTEDNNDFLMGPVFGDDFSSSAFSNFLVITFYLEPQEAEIVFLALERGVLNLSICPQNEVIKY